MSNEEQIKLSGRVVCSGKVEGIARIINSYEDLDNVKEGDILVAAQTDMNYTPYLEKSSGLITETGGRYCHAAIYARENNLTCIVGVLNAREIIIDNKPLILDGNVNEIYLK